ncbi:mucolipin-3-like isoform X2 [Argopecten irradians]|uniref:mucolipin-3-like isoform X2 n=1 Tax=Argopecten irradians TaxID=31199 RepID=UPI003718CBA9
MDEEDQKNDVPSNPIGQKHGTASADVGEVTVNLKPTPLQQPVNVGPHETTDEQEENQTPCCNWEKTEENLRDQLKIHFSHTMARCCRNNMIVKKIPYKMVLLLFNIVLVTSQLVIFANERSQFATFLNRNNVALKHLLLRDWSKDYETMPYPPTTGTYAVYTIDDMKDHVHHVVQGIHSLPTKAVGPFFLNNDNASSPLVMCITYFKYGVFNKTSDPPSISIDRTRETQCRNIGNTTEYGFDPSLDDLLKSENGVLVRLLELTLDFSVASVHLDMRREERQTECFEIIGRVTFDNYDIHGQIPVTLTTSIKGFECEGDLNTRQESSVNIVLLIFVFAVNICSIIGSVRSFVNSYILWLEVKHFFLHKYKDCKPLSRRGGWEILRFRDVMITISGLLTIIGSCIKISYDVGHLSTSDGLDVCGILLGLGCMMLWILSLHYLAFNKVFMLLFLVLDRSASSVVRFLMCIFVMYIGFALYAWAVLGPHHIKFLSFTATFQCLLALMNGDEVYVTMTAVDEGNQIAYWFNFVFITVFIFLFTIITLNVFIAIYNTTYEDIMDGEHRSDLREFIGKSDKEIFTLDCSKCNTDTCKW